MSVHAVLAPPTLPTTPGACASLACIWEATAAKPGNVYRGADFADLSYVDFLTSAAVVAPVVDAAAELGVGGVVLQGVQATRAAIGPKNTNLGILLLMAPLAVAYERRSLRESVGRVLAELSENDARDVYAAIRLVQPGGLGRVQQADVNDLEAPALPLRQAMQLGAERDLVARQYVNNFADVFAAADNIVQHAAARPLDEAIVLAFLELLRDQPDSLVARKCGRETAERISARAAQVLSTLPDSQLYTAALSDFDFWLRSDGNRLNPGTSADIIAAALFSLLLERKLKWPVTFY